MTKEKFERLKKERDERFAKYDEKTPKKRLKMTDRDYGAWLEDLEELERDLEAEVEDYDLCDDIMDMDIFEDEK